MEKTWWVDEGQLDVRQKEILGLPPHGSYLIKGPPGSGKTNLLVLRANYLTLSGVSDLAVVVFNRTLCEFMRSGSADYKFDPKKVVTANRFIQTLLGELGIKIKRDSKPFTQVRAEMSSELSRQIAAGKVPRIHEVILLDESQDYWPQEIDVFSRLAKDLFAVADSRQKVYEGDDCIPLLHSKVQKVIELEHHYRNGIQICKLADQVGAHMTGGYEPIEPTANYPEGKIPSKYDVHQGTISEQAAEIADAVKRQRRTYPDELIGVVCPRGAEVSEVAEHLRKQGLGDQLTVQSYEDGYLSMDSSRPVWVSTIHSAKGLEFRALHVAGLDHVTSFGSQQKRLAFTAITRAKTNLDLYHERALPAYLQGALDTLRPDKKIASIKDAFGR